MALRIRLRRQGRTNRPFYRLVVTEGDSRRDGAYLEAIGWYDPLKVENNCVVKQERVQHWLAHGAQLTERAESLVARNAPAVMQQQRAKVEEKRAKLRAKRKAR